MNFNLNSNFFFFCFVNLIKTEILLKQKNWTGPVISFSKVLLYLLLHNSNIFLCTDEDEFDPFDPGILSFIFGTNGSSSFATGSGSFS